MDNKENNTNPNPEPEMEIEVEVEEIEISETPVSSAAPESMEVPVQTEVPTQTNMGSEQPLFAKEPKAAAAAGSKPKKKIGTIIAICVAAVLLIGGGVFAAIYMSWRNSDPVVILDAVTGVMKKSKIAVNGTMDIRFNEENQDESGIKSMKLTLDSDQDGADASGSGKLTIVTSTDDTAEIGIGGAYVSDGTIYIKIDGVGDALTSLDLPDEAAAIMDYLEDLIDDIDGQWYKIEVSDLGLDAEAEESYQCMVDTLNESVKEDSKTELVDLYKKYPFIVSEKKDKKDSDGNTIYNVSWDADDLAGYLNGMTDTKAYESIAACADSITEETITSEDVAVPEDMPTLNLHINGSHELRGFSAKYEEDGNSLNAEFYFEYDNKVNVEIPSNAKSVGDLMTSVEDALMGVVTAMMQEQVESQCSSYTGSLYNECIEYYTDAVEEYLQEMDFSDIWSLTGSMV
ncbi:MAG: hypothetical protein ACK5MU_03070 [Candidatus Saccharimonadales bacterium]